MKKLLVILLGVLFLTACSNPAEGDNEVTADKVIQAFKDAGLEAENPTDLKEKEFGNTREEGKRILVPSLGDDAGGRLFKFKNKDDLKKAKAYYDDLGNSSPLFFSHTYAKDNFLLQMNGDMKDDQFEKYKAVMDKEIK
ncbi:membrane lipoprotein lipid attachment site-containing protein [Bacillus haynesii]|uniref:membrane lipoprotein lipid attachment site-containing protein n=1 Tax=Bacillus haynesii TaxID=1925021 RepID=UPI0003EDA384|nr:membrane lipoprotein lipid attachment site-containing protein [Bacillus haynesii]EWH20411.1 hypothetical protein M769_0120685 [Bacillus haynesii]MCY7771313.1 membrane lipoprotein lipid attachment site-containing protein [Bacillus haynesii]MCY9372070.1 membrane lipoprotein lipid attachment site-containing protein [Bacillus haynesii]MEC0701350.1 membrane lipoprotein lipid attachment site-containing protein [Bacillus haynesii]MEC0761085.1 membrane lipoprotein lipid attachment site-containing p